MATDKSNGTNATGNGLHANAARDAAFLRFLAGVWNWSRSLNRPIKRAELRRRNIGRRETDKLTKFGILVPDGNGFSVNNELVEKIRRHSGSAKSR